MLDEYADAEVIMACRRSRVGVPARCSVTSLTVAEVASPTKFGVSQLWCGSLRLPYSTSAMRSRTNTKRTLRDTVRWMSVL